MNIGHCEFEKTVLRAVQPGQLTSSLQAHLDTCKACQETQLIAAFLRALPEEQLNSLPLPSSESIWWRGQIARKQDLAERSVAVIGAVQKAAVALMIGLLGVLTILWAPQLLSGPSHMEYLSVAILLSVSSALVLYAWATERI